MFVVRRESRSFANSDQLFAKDWQQAYHILECLPPKKSGIAIAKAGKLCSTYNCYKRHGKPWGVKEGGDTEDTRNINGNLLCPSRE